MPVLPQAFELTRAGYALKLATQTPWAFELQSAAKQAEPRAAADSGLISE